MQLVQRNSTKKKINLFMELQPSDSMININAKPLAKEQAKYFCLGALISILIRVLKRVRNFRWK